jgi:hypothetical protein
VRWVGAIDRGTVVRVGRKLLDRPTDIAGRVDELSSLDGPVRDRMNVIGGIAGLVGAMLAGAGLIVVHPSGLAVSRARQVTIGSESKSGPGMPAPPPSGCRTRADLRTTASATGPDLETTRPVRHLRAAGGSASRSLGQEDSHAFHDRRRREGNATTRPSSRSRGGAWACPGPSCAPASPSSPGSKRPLDPRIRLPRPTRTAVGRSSTSGPR